MNVPALECTKRRRVQIPFHSAPIACCFLTSDILILSLWAECVLDFIATRPLIDAQLGPK